jgi:hypothetical protein
MDFLVGIEPDSVDNATAVIAVPLNVTSAYTTRRTHCGTEDKRILSKKRTDADRII